MMLDKEDFQYYKGFVEGWRRCHSEGSDSMRFNQETVNMILKRELTEHSEITDEETLTALMEDS